MISRLITRLDYNQVRGPVHVRFAVIRACIIKQVAKSSSLLYTPDVCFLRLLRFG